MRRSLFAALVSLWLALPGLAWAQENCTFTTSGNWTAAATYSGTVTGAPCTLSADDNIAFGAGVTVTVTTGSTVTKTNGSITGTGTGLLSIASGGRLESGGDGITLTNLTMAGRFLEYDAAPAFTLTEPPDEPRIGLTIPCPGWDDSATLYVEDCDENLGDPGDVAGDASEQAICWPEAQFPVASSFYDNIAAAIAVGDVIWFWDPTIDKNPPHQVNFPFEVVDITESAGTQHCVIVDVRQDCQSRAVHAVGTACPHAPAGVDSISLANRENKIAIADPALLDPGTGALTLASSGGFIFHAAENGNLNFVSQRNSTATAIDTGYDMGTPASATVIGGWIDLVFRADYQDASDANANGRVRAWVNGRLVQDAANILPPFTSSHTYAFVLELVNGPAAAQAVDMGIKYIFTALSEPRI